MKRLKIKNGGSPGAIMPLTAAILVAAIGCLALVVDLGYIYLVKSELQRAADAGAVAGALGLQGVAVGVSGPQPLTPDCARALTAAQTVVAANKADGAALQLPASDVTFGRWDAGTFSPIGCGAPMSVNAVKVLVRKDAGANGPVNLFFAGILPGGLGSVNLTAQAIGLMGYAGYAPPGVGTFPLAVDANKVPPLHSGEVVRIDLNPTTTDGGAWHTFDDRSPGAKDLRGLVNGSIPSPPLRVGDNIRVTEGVADSVLQELAQQFNNRNGVWDILTPVISGDTHTGWTQVLGFVNLRLTSVVATGADKHIEGYTIPNYVAPRVDPGGPNYGMWSGVPKLVQ
jgi:hypothetical protein